MIFRAFPDVIDPFPWLASGLDTGDWFGQLKSVNLTAVLRYLVAAPAIVDCLAACTPYYPADNRRP